MARGKVKWYSASKGYGFVQPDDGSKDVFLHVTALEKSGISSVSEGQTVEFEVEKRAKGPSVSKIELV